MFNEFVTDISNAMHTSGELPEATYEGERNAAGQPEGRGTQTFATGDVYEGEWRAGKKEGRGTYTHSNGMVYEGEWMADKQEGRGTMRYADGAVKVSLESLPQRRRLSSSFSK